MRTLVHLSDLHFGRVDERLLEPLARRVHALAPDVVAVSGDLTQRARTAQFRAARRFLDTLPQPLLVVPGNHDVPLYNLWQRFLHPLAKYRRYISEEVEPAYIDNLPHKWSGVVAEEALAIGVYSALCAWDFTSGVRIAVNHSGASGASGAICGALLGTHYGASALPQDWLDVLELRSIIETVGRDFAREHRLVLVLKGWRTLIADPEGNIWVNTTGNPGLAKGGSGDVLTGMIAGFIAQFPDHIVNAVRAAVYLHGFAAEVALSQQTERTMLATDVISAFAPAFRQLGTPSEGFAWIQGRVPYR